MGDSDGIVAQTIHAQTMSDAISDGQVLDSTTESSFLTTEGVTKSSNGTYIYDYYNQVDIVKVLLHATSILLLFTANVFWCIIWRNVQVGHPYRCISFMIILTFAAIYHIVGLIGMLVYVPEGYGCQILMTLKSYGDIGMCTFCFMYVLLCIGIAMRRLEFGIKFYFLIVVALLLPLVLVIATNSLKMLLHPETKCDLLDELSHHIWYNRAPKCFLLFGTICILAVLFYWLFCFDNTMFKLNRDFLLIRHSSATLMILVCYCFFLELYEIVFLSHGADGEIKTICMARNGMILTILICSKGSIAAFLLCFFDLEIFSVIHTFPCCPDLSNAILDQSWEKRIRSESKVKFFEDSSDDSQTGTRHGSYSFEKEKDRVLSEPQVIQRYGTLESDGD